MLIHRSRAGRILIVLAGAACTVILLAHESRKSTQHAATGDAPVIERSAAYYQNDADLRLIRATVNSLRHIHTDSTDPDIPVIAKPLLTTLKHQLRDFIA